MPRFARLAPLALLLLAMALAWRLDLGAQLSWATLAAHRAALRGAVAAYPLASAALYLAVYAAAIGISLPGGALLTVAGGLLFGTLAGAVLAVLGATLGAVIIFLAARFALADLLAARAGGLLAARAGGLLDRVRPGLERDGFTYLLALRLIPVVPFWLLNLAPALVGMRLAPYAAATLLGVAPASLVFASIGAGLGDVLASGAAPDLSVILSARVLLPLLGLAALALAPIAWRRWKAAHA